MNDYDLTQQPIFVELTKKKAAEVKEFCHEVERHKLANGGDWANTFRFPVATIMATSIQGFLGEVAISQVLDIPYEYELKASGDDGWDLDYHGIRIQTKVGKGPSLIFYELKHFKTTADAAIFAEFLGDRDEPDLDPCFKVWGWCSRKDFVNHYEVRDFGFGDNCYVSGWKLRPLATLRDYADAVNATPPSRSSHARQDQPAGHRR